MTAATEDDLARLSRRLFESPGDGDAHLAAGRLHAAGERFDRAAAHLRVAVAAEPSAARWAELAAALQAAGRIAEASTAVERALALDARAAQAWSVRGSLAAGQGRLEEARAHFERALELRPGYAPALMGLAAHEEARGRFADAIARYRQALGEDPSLAAAHFALGVLHQRRIGDVGEAIAHYRRAIAARPEHASAHHNLSHALLEAGRFDEAWREHAWRPPRARHEAALARAGRRYALPDAHALAGTRIALVAEQGLGDTLFFLRFAPLLPSRGVMLEFAGDRRLADMLARTGLFAAVVEKAGQLPVAERHEVLVGDVALLLPDAGTPPPLRLEPVAQRLREARERLAALGPAPYIGLAWRAGDPRTGPHETLFKEAPREALGAALRGLEATFVSLQREPAPGEREAIEAALGRTIHDVSDVNRDLEAALATMAALDEVVGVSNTNVHLRAGVGGGARVLVPFPPEWRWMAAGESPWFPAMRTYRQETDGSWDGALDALARDLRSST